MNNANTLERALSAEERTAELLIKAAQQLVRLQFVTQYEAGRELATAMREAAEIKVEITIGAFPSIRAASVNAEGDETCLLFNLDMQPAGTH